MSGIEMMTGPNTPAAARLSFRHYLAAPLALVLAGCISFGAEPPESLLTLTSEATAPVGTAVAITPENTIAVFEPSAPARLDVTRVPVQVDSNSIAYLKEALWVERPARLFRRLLSETLRARGDTNILGEDDVGLVATSIVRGSLVDFGYDAPSRSVIVRFDAVYSRGEGTPQTRRFESIVPNIEPEAAPVGVALNQAANDVARQVAAWIG